jgi:hypothetical protein
MEMRPKAQISDYFIFLRSNPLAVDGENATLPHRVLDQNAVDIDNYTHIQRGKISRKMSG